MFAASLARTRHLQAPAATGVSATIPALRIPVPG
jgi:hypothetical protein